MIIILKYIALAFIISTILLIMGGIILSSLYAAKHNISWLIMSALPIGMLLIIGLECLFYNILD